MASTGINNGGIAQLLIGSPANQVVVTNLINCSFSFTHEGREVSTKDSTNGAKDYKPGMTGWSMSGEALMAENATYGRKEIFDLCKNRTLVQVQYGSLELNDQVYKGAAYISNVSSSAGGQEDNESFSVEIIGTGALTRRTQQT